jgi:hypothetical protein
VRQAALALLLAAVAAPAAAAEGVPLDDLRAQDQRLLSIVEPLLAGNAKLCDQTMPDLGVALQSVDQYSTGERPNFAASVAFAAVLPGSAAAQAGIERDDGLAAIDGQPVEKRANLVDSPLRDSAFAMLADHDPAQPLVLTVVHDGEQRDVTIPDGRECRALVEILDAGGNAARSDGRVIQLAYGLAVRASDAQIAVIVAHELAHAILHHRERLSAAGVDKGLAGQFGRDRRLNLEAEEQADRLSVYLLADAGFDPHAAPEFWRSKLGRHLSGGIFHDRAHLSAKKRAALMDREIADHFTDGVASYPAQLLATRDEPFD